MRLKSLSIRNFLSFRGTHEFDLDHDTILLLGKSGSGKTAIQEAILYALFNASPRTISAGRGVTDLITRGESELEVVLEIEKDSTEVCIRRKRNNQNTELFIAVNGLDEKFTTLTSGAKKLASILEFPFITSKYVPLIYFSHSSLKDSISGEIEKTWLESLYKILKLRVKTQVNSLEIQCSSVRKEVYVLEGHLEERKKPTKQAKEIQSELDAIAVIAKKLELDAQKAQVEIDEVSEQREDTNKKLYGLSHRVKKAEALLSQDTCPACERPITQTLRSTLEHKLKKEKEDITTWSKRSEYLAKQVKELREKMSRVKKELYRNTAESSMLTKDLTESYKRTTATSEIADEHREKCEEAKEIEELLKASLEVRSLLSDSYTELLRHIYDEYIIPPVQKWAPALFYEPLAITAEWTGRDIELRITRKNKVYPYELLSTGEKVRLQILLKISIARFLSSLASSPFLLLDELLDSLDFDSAVSTLSLLREESSNQIIITSHRKELRDHHLEGIKVYSL